MPSNKYYENFRWVIEKLDNSDLLSHSSMIDEEIVRRANKLKEDDERPRALLDEL